MNIMRLLARLLKSGRRGGIYVCMAVVLVVVSVVNKEVGATPSTTFWAPSTPYLQPYGVLHVTYDTYFNDIAAYPIDTGLTMGVLPWEKLQMEVGFDYMSQTRYPVIFNAKIGTPEGKLFKGSPGWSLGIFNWGTKKDVNDLNIYHFMLGKTLPGGIYQAGVYKGSNEKLFLSSTGKKEESGYMFGWFSPDIKAPKLEKIVLAADVMTGKNSLGAWGGGVYFYFAPWIDLLTGPVYFNDRDLQPGKSHWLWTMQLDVDWDLHSNTKK